MRQLATCHQPPKSSPSMSEGAGANAQLLEEPPEDVSPSLTITCTQSEAFRNHLAPCPRHIQRPAWPQAIERVSTIRIGACLPLFRLLSETSEAEPASTCSEQCHIKADFAGFFSSSKPLITRPSVQQLHFPPIAIGPSDTRNFSKRLIVYTRQPQKWPST